MKENLFSIIVALVLATWIFFILRLVFWTSLQNNILWSQEEALLWDIVIETYNDRVSLVGNKEIMWVAAISVMAFFDDEEVDLDIENIDWVWETQVLDNDAWRISLFINQIDWLKKWTVIQNIPVRWDATKVTISDVVFQFKDNSSERASVSMK